MGYGRGKREIDDIKHQDLADARKARVFEKGNGTRYLLELVHVKRIAVCSDMMTTLMPQKINLHSRITKPTNYEKHWRRGCAVGSVALQCKHCYRNHSVTSKITITSSSLLCDSFTSGPLAEKKPRHPSPPSAPLPSPSATRRSPPSPSPR